MSFGGSSRNVHARYCRSLVAGRAVISRSDHWHFLPLRRSEALSLARTTRPHRRSAFSRRRETPGRCIGDTRRKRDYRRPRTKWLRAVCTASLSRLPRPEIAYLPFLHFSPIHLHRTRRIHGYPDPSGVGKVCARRTYGHTHERILFFFCFHAPSATGGPLKSVTSGLRGD